jgi:Flp pilus assembly protein TadB
MLVGFLLMASPLTVLLGVIPFFETLADIGAFMLALLLALPLTLIVIAAAWITHRPLIGGALIAAGLGLAYLLRRLHRARQPQPPTHFLPTSP